LESGGDEAVKQFEKELNVLTWSVRKDVSWVVDTTTPIINNSTRSILVEKRILRLGCSKFFASCILNIMKRDGLKRLNQLRLDYEEIMRDYRREIDVLFVTAKKLSNEELEYYKKNLKLNYLKPEDNMIFSTFVDPKIKYGFVVTVAGDTYDFTWDKAINEEEKKISAQSHSYESERLELITQPVKVTIKEVLAKLLEKEDIIPTDSFAKFVEQ